MALEQTRPPTPEENRQWGLLVDRYFGPVSAACNRLALTVKVAAYIDQYTREQGLSITTMSDEQRAEAKRTLDQYNALGSVIRLVEQGTYLIKFTDAGDIAIHSPAGMPLEEYAAHQLGAVPIVLVVVAGAVLISACFVLMAIIEKHAEEQRTALESQIITADQQIAALGGQAAATWGRFKDQNKDRITQTAKELGVEPGLIARLFGSATSKDVGTLLIGGLILWALWYMQKHRAQAPTKNPCPSPMRGGSFAPPDTWNVKWSADPAKRKRQLENLLDRMPRAASKYAKFWDYETPDYWQTAAPSGDFEQY
jgi:hypothetical protein